jgi:DNA polymerase elongation subunit (family B)
MVDDVYDMFVLIAHDDEAAMLREFWTAIQGNNGQLHTLIGFNCNSFDLPFLIKRSWKLGVVVPVGIRRGRYWGEQIIDLRDVWQCGDRQAAGSLDTIAKHLGVGAKTGSGADFAALWKTDRPHAEAYLKNDISITAAIARKLGVL